MLSRQIRLRNRIPARSVVVAVILLVGVLSMAYGYYQNSHAMVYVGLVITFAGALNGIFLSVIWPSASRIAGHRH
jgi:uncharacterized membrane protein